MLELEEFDWNLFWIRRFEVGFVERWFVGFISLKHLSSLLFVALSASALDVVAPFV